MNQDVAYARNTESGCKVISHDLYRTASKKSPTCWLVYAFFVFVEGEAKALVLSSGVLKSLQTTCDAADVVALLPELDEATLADPGPEKTRLIRCVSMEAKSADRLDVVKHLRQITPAGTTGVVRCCFILVRLFLDIEEYLRQLTLAETTRARSLACLLTRF